MSSEKTDVFLSANSEVQVCTEDANNCTYVAIFTAPPGGCFYASMNTNANEEHHAHPSLHVTVQTPCPRDILPAKFDSEPSLPKCSCCQDVWPGDSFDVPDLEALVELVTPLVTRRCHGKTLWAQTLACDAEQPFSTVFPDIVYRKDFLEENATVRRPRCTLHARLHSRSYGDNRSESSSSTSPRPIGSTDHNQPATTVYGNEHNSLVKEETELKILIEDPSLPNIVPSYTATTTTTVEDEDDARECWICKDTEGKLIMPCLCKGSMQGVHLQCVEDWVRVCNATKGERPQCPVCKTPYAGRETIPGLASYTAHMAKYIACLTIRGLMLVATLITFWLSLKDWLITDLPTRVVIWVVGSLFLATKIALVTCAIPPVWRTVPFFGNDVSFASIHSEGTKCTMELCATLAILIIWGLFDEVEWIHVAPITVVSVAPPILKWVISESMAGCNVCLPRVLESIRSMLLCPCLLLREAWWAVREDPRHHLSPMNYLIHTVLSIALLIFGSIPNDIPFLVTCTAHCGILFMMMGLHMFSSTWKLKRGRLWWVQLQICGLAVYCVNVLRAFIATENAEHSWFAASALTFSLCCYALNVVVVVSANWHGIKKQYDRWQRRNGSFTFDDHQGM